ncbi:MAG: hypothetical protein K8I29_09830 [Alphaproteobacteria bacterium]|uniref:Uncharacterized protein n=1 Tax=Candidatus Nitrobium versatile TaxID=2884831 RepID=A0A953J584_9BACT|nr:hypothetical protein [Candidatus Nitrobium versatile]
MRDIIEKLLIEPIRAFGERIVQFLPNLFSALFILLIGLLAAWATRYLLARLFRFMRLDNFSERSGVNRIIMKGGIREPFSVILAQFVGCLVSFSFAIIALNSLRVPAIEMLIEKFFLYLPNIFVAFLIILFGYLFSNFLERAALIASVNAGLRTAGTIGRLVRLFVFVFSFSVALEQLGIGKDTVTIAFALLFGGIVLGLSLAFGLGGKDIAKSYLEKRVFGKEKDDDIEHL